MLIKPRFVNCEKWRSTFGGGVDDLVKNFEYVEKPKVFEYYPQYYHKIDKVCIAHTPLPLYHRRATPR
jgi:hypothetical protein